MNVVILAPGSRGDVQPYLALAQALASLGHAPTLVTTLDHASLVRSYGLEPALVDVDVAAELAQVEARRAVEGGGVLSSFRVFTDIARRASRGLAEVSLAASQGADVIVTNFGTALVASALGQKLGLPVVQAYNVPVTPSAELPGALFPALDLGGPLRRLGTSLTRAALWQTARASASAACTEVLGAPPAPMLPPGREGLLEGPVLYGFSEHFLARPRDWSPAVRVTGFWTVQEASDAAPPDPLARFLDAGPPPVCIGFGSMSTERPEDVSALVLDAARRAHARVVLLSGWAGLTPGLVSDDVLALRAVPHTWLYPRCAAVVHHRGAGTTAAAVQAGVPAVVVPFHGDQPFWASRVHRLGLGPAPIPRRALTADRLAAALRIALGDEAMRARATRLGERVQSEQGALRAAEQILESARR